MKINPILLILLIFLVPISACISTSSSISNESVLEKDPLLGTWTSPQFNESEITFFEDGNFFATNKFGCIIYPESLENRFTCKESQMDEKVWKFIKYTTTTSRKTQIFGLFPNETKIIDNWYQLDYKSTEFGTSPLCEDQSNCWIKRNSTLVFNYNSTNDRLTRWYNLSYQEPEMRKYYWVRVNSQK